MKHYSNFMPPPTKNLDELKIDSKVQFQKYMHAFMSLISLEEVGCTLDEKNNNTTCALGAESGWIPQEYFDLHLQTLKIIQSKNLQFKNSLEVEDKLATLKFSEFIKRTITLTEIMIDFNKTLSVIHVDKINSSLNQPGRCLLYPWMTITDPRGQPRGHQIYLMIIRETDNTYTLKISDLGYGRTGETNGELKPIQLKFNHKESFDLYIHFLTKMRGSFTSLALYKAIYGKENENICFQCIPDIPQRTGNCVVKNLLDAIKQDAIATYGSELGICFFQTIYLQSLNLNLEGATKNCVKLSQELMSVDRIVGYIQNNQSSFTKLSQAYVKSHIVSAYQQLFECTRPIPMQTIPTFSTDLTGGNYFLRQ